jgi:hypothetical protein
MKKEYLGDGAYVRHDGYSFVLTTEDGIQATNTIYLEPEHIDMLVDYVQRVYNQMPNSSRAVQK